MNPRIEEWTETSASAHGPRLLDVRVPWPALRDIDERLEALRDQLQPRAMEIRTERAADPGEADPPTATVAATDKATHFFNGGDEADSPVLQAISLLRGDPDRSTVVAPPPRPPAAAPGAAAPDPAAGTEQTRAVGPVGAEVRPRSHTRSGWIGGAIRQLAAIDPELCGRAILGLLPIQGDVITDEVVYDLVITGGRCYSVTVTEEETSVCRVPGPRPLDTVDGRIESTLTGLAAVPNAGRLRGRRRSSTLRVQGRRSKRALAAFREVVAAPVSLAQSRAAGVDLAPDLLLSLITAALPAAWTIGHCFTTEFITEGVGASATRLYLRVNDGRLVSVSRGLPLDVPSATVTCRPDELAGVLAGDGSAGNATLAGDRAPLMLLQGWVSRLESGRG